MAPVVIQVVLFASNLYANGTPIALALPFVLGLGMELPWPIAGAAIDAACLDDRDLRRPPGLVRVVVAVRDAAHVELADGGPLLRAVRPAVDD